MSKVGIGIIGASPRSWWAALSHIPALKSLADVDVRAVATSRAESAEEARRELGAATAYTDPDALARDPSVELVVVSVNVGKHHDLVRRVIDAGKHVFCEWPLGLTSEEAEDLAARAAARNVRTFIGLQARYAPAVRTMRDLVATGYVGKLFGTTLVASGEFWGPEIARASAYVFDRTKGATVVTASAMHALDALMSVLGEIRGVASTLATRRDHVRISGTDETFVPTAPDQVALHGTLEGGAVFSSFHRGGHSRGNNFRWEINGSEGDLVLTSASGYMQHSPLVLAGGRASDAAVAIIEPSPEHVLAGLPPGPPTNVGLLYAAAIRDLQTGTHTVPGFDVAVRRHRLVDAIFAGGAQTL